jgi:CTP synthase (UTP-ammonia lyase)
MELKDHPFFTLTGFAPQLAPDAERGHPILRAFLTAAAGG